MRRVEATFSDRRISVSISSSDGKTENSTGWRTYRTVSSSTTDSPMSMASSMSSTSGGSGTTIISTTASAAAGAM